MAIPKSSKLAIIDSAVQTVGHNRVKPSVYFNPIAQPTTVPIIAHTSRSSATFVSF